jgi:hypothetical protein
LPQESECTLGPLFSGAYTGGQIGNVNFNGTYGGAFVAGTFGFENVTFAGLTVQNAQVSSVTTAHFTVPNVSGLIGLAFPALTSEYPGTDPTDDQVKQIIAYEPIFFKMVDQKLTPPTFSFAPDRNGTNGLLALGGVPAVNTTGPTASTPMLSVSILQALWKRKNVYVTD